MKLGEEVFYEILLNLIAQAVCLIKAKNLKQYIDSSHIEVLFSNICNFLNRLLLRREGYSPFKSRNLHKILTLPNNPQKHVSNNHAKKRGTKSKI